ncbi:myosin [Salix suchowensis]|nr:myosin [Salix suchowensis]
MYVMIFLNPYALVCGSSLCYLLLMNGCCNVCRYQRVSPDCVPLSNGKKTNGVENGRSIPNGFDSTSTNFEAKGFRFRSPSRNQDHHNNSTTSPPHSDNNHNHTQRHGTSPSPSPSRGGNGDMLLQWGQKKRARVSRSEIRAFPDESSSSGQGRHPISKIPRRVDNRLSPSSMPPPPPPPSSQQQSTSTNTRGGTLKKGNSGILSHRNLEKRPGAGNGSPSRNSGGSGKVVSRSTARKRSPPTPENIDRKMPSSRSAAKDEKPNGSIAVADHQTRQADSTRAQLEKEAGVTNSNLASVPVVAGGGEKVNNNEVIEWPRIYIALSRKEKEDDFFAIKGTKLPQRPKKRAKNIDKALQYCFPGMWLSDLTKSRYEVREKKCVKKQKRRGLKGMESMDSDSE